jgi:hypothetical protein
MTLKSINESAIASKDSSSLPAARTPTSASARPITIVTHRMIAASPGAVWKSLCFYEDVAHKAPFLLRLMLPRPVPAASAVRAEGEETTLRYEDGHYAKRVKKLEPQRHYEFDVIDQRLASDRGVMLLSGAYTLVELPSNRTDLAITTRYSSRIGPRWLAEPIEAILCRRLHKHLLDAIQAQAES